MSIENKYAFSNRNPIPVDPLSGGERMLRLLWFQSQTTRIKKPLDAEDISFANELPLCTLYVYVNTFWFSNLTDWFFKIWPSDLKNKASWAYE